MRKLVVDMEMEEFGRVIDFLPDGRAADRLREPLAQLLGEKYFTILEVSIKREAKLSLGQRIYIGKEARQEVDKIKRRLEFFDLTATAKNELPTVARQIVHDREAEFVSFFNKAGPISMRLHQVELLPGIGKKHLAQILDARAEKPFESFKDIQTRVALLPDPTGLLITRIEEELAGSSKHHLFVRPPSKHSEHGMGY
jgi:putative nucleotide binding protein